MQKRMLTLFKSFNEDCQLHIWNTTEKPKWNIWSYLPFDILQFLIVILQYNFFYFFYAKVDMNLICLSVKHIWKPIYAPHVGITNWQTYLPVMFFSAPDSVLDICHIFVWAKQICLKVKTGNLSVAQFVRVRQNGKRFCIQQFI